MSSIAVAHLHLRPRCAPGRRGSRRRAFFLKILTFGKQLTSSWRRRRPRHQPQTKPYHRLPSSLNPSTTPARSWPCAQHEAEVPYAPRNAPEVFNHEGGKSPAFVHESSFIRHPSRHRSRCPPAVRTACPCCSPSTAHRSRSSKPIALLLK